MPWLAGWVDPEVGGCRCCRTKHASRSLQSSEVSSRARNEARARRSERATRSLPTETADRRTLSCRPFATRSRLCCSLSPVHGTTGLVAEYTARERTMLDVVLNHLALAAACCLVSLGALESFVSVTRRASSSSEVREFVRQGRPHRRPAERADSLVSLVLLLSLEHPARHGRLDAPHRAAHPGHLCRHRQAAAQRPRHPARPLVRAPHRPVLARPRTRSVRGCLGPPRLGPHLPVRPHLRPSDPPSSESAS